MSHATPGEVQDGLSSGLAVREPRHRMVRAAAAAGWAAATVGGLTGLLIRLLDPVPIVKNSYGVDTPGAAALLVLAIAWASVGSLLMVRRPENATGRWVLLVGMGHALSILFGAATSSALARGSSWNLPAEWFAWFGGLASLLGAGVFFLALIFPTGRAHTHRWDAVGRILLLLSGAGIVYLQIAPGPMHDAPGVNNPLGIGPELDGFGNLGPIVLTLAVIVNTPFVVASMVSRYRTGSVVVKAQLRWFVASIVLMLMALGLLGITGLVESADLGQAPFFVFALTGSLVPVAILIAITRYRLYEIDRIISRSLSWIVLTSALVAIFALAIVALQAALAGFTQGQTLAVAASTLLALTLFQPLRRRTQDVVDRRFDRSRYDRERVVASFGDRLRSDVDLQALESEIRRVVDITTRPASLAVWLRGATNSPSPTSS
jgi:hypothetical protein